MAHTPPRTLSVWSGFGTGNDYQEWDFTAAYTFELGPAFLTPGYNFRYQPGVVEHEHPGSAQDEHGHDEEHTHSGGHGHDEPGGHHEHSHPVPGHFHDIHGNEIFFMLGITVIPYVTPSMFFVCDLNNTPAHFLEVRLDGDIPLYIFQVQPYALLGLS